MSSVTARADLDALAESGKLRRTHGGAVSLQKRLTVSNPGIAASTSMSPPSRPSRKAPSSSSSVAATRCSSTRHHGALEFVRLLDRRDGITVITADITIADYIDESMPSVDARHRWAGLRKGHRYLYGPLTMQALQMVHADLAVMCPGALSPLRLLRPTLPQMAETKTAMIAAAHQSVAPHGRQQG